MFLTLSLLSAPDVQEPYAYSLDGKTVENLFERISKNAIAFLVAQVWPGSSQIILVFIYRCLINTLTFTLLVVFDFLMNFIQPINTSEQILAG